MQNAIRSFGAVILSAAALTTYAATDGVSGGSSTGNTVITLDFDKLISVGGLKNIGLDVSNNYTSGTDLCVGQSGGVTSYDVTLTSANASASNEFRLSDNATTPSYVIYGVSYTHDNDSVATGVQGTPSSATTSGAVVGTFGNGTNEVALGALNCTADTTARIDVTISSSELEAASAATYTDTLTVTVQAI